MVAFGGHWFAPLLFLAALLVFPPLSLWLRLLILRHSARVPDEELREWALREASSRRMVELIRALRGKEPHEPADADLPGRAVVDAADGAGVPVGVPSGGKHSIGNEPARDGVETGARITLAADALDYWRGDEARSA